MCSGHYWGPREAQNIKIVVLRAYLHRTQPDAPATDVLNPIQLKVLKATVANRKKLPPVLTVAWAIESVAFLGGFLEHRRHSPIGIQVLWRGWLKLHDLSQGWLLAKYT